jgi:hypothetical protein
MTCKTQVNKAASSPDMLRITHKAGMSSDAQLAELTVDGIANNAVMVRSFSKQMMGDTDLTSCFDALSEKAQQVANGDLSGLERLLTAQAYALDKMFNELARRAALNMGEHLDATDRYMRLALKAQSQSRATAESLANIKNPSIVYAKQANIAHGPQQVNNGVLPEQYAHARAGAGNSKILQNELLEGNNGERLDVGAQAKASGTNQAMEALGAVNGAANK